MDRGRLVTLGDRLAGDELVEQDALLRECACSRGRRQHVGRDAGVDRQDDIGVRRDGEVDRRGQRQGEVDVGVQIEQRHGQDLLGREDRAPFRLELVQGKTCVLRSIHEPHLRDSVGTCADTAKDWGAWCMVTPCGSSTEQAHVPPLYRFKRGKGFRLYSVRVVP